MLLAFDIGGTKMRLATSSDGETIDQKVEFLTAPEDYDEMVAQFLKTAQELSGGKKIVGAAGGIPGTLRDNKTTIHSAPNLPGWRGKAFAKDISKALNAPVFLENDTATIGIGEATFGAGKGKHIVVYVTVSTGVGGCRIVDGAIDAASHGFEPGHHIVTSEDTTCACGGKGHLEAIIGGASLRKRHGMDPADITDSAVWDEAARYLAIGLNNLVMLWSPDIFVVGGSVTQSLSLEKASHHLRDLVTIYDDIPAIVPPELGTEAGFLGGLAILRSHRVKV